MVKQSSSPVGWEKAGSRLLASAFLPRRDPTTAAAAPHLQLPLFEGASRIKQQTRTGLENAPCCTKSARTLVLAKAARVITRCAGKPPAAASKAVLGKSNSEAASLDWRKPVMHSLLTLLEVLHCRTRLDW